MVLNWVWFVLGASVISAASFLVDRFVLRDCKDNYAYGLIVQAGVALPLGVYVLANPTVWPSDWTVWAMAVAGGVLWAFSFLLLLKTDTVSDVSLKAPLMRVRLILTVFLAGVFLGEPVTTAKLVALAFILGGIVIAFSSKTTPWRQALNQPAVALLAVEAFFYTAAAFLDKKAIAGFAYPAAYGFLTSVVISLVVFALFNDRLKRTAAILHAKGKAIFLNVALYSALVFFWYSAIFEAQASQVSLVFELTLPFMFIGGVVFLGERENLKRRALGSFLVLIGGVIAALAA